MVFVIVIWQLGQTDNVNSELMAVCTVPVRYDSNAITSRKFSGATT